MHLKPRLRRILGSIFRKCLLVYIGCVAVLPFLGLLLLMWMGIALFLLGIDLSGIDKLGEWPYRSLSLGWKLYTLGTLFVMFVLTTVGYLHCCEGVNTFKTHLKHMRFLHKEIILISILWPYKLYAIHSYFKGWNMTWCDVVLDATHYWFIDRWEKVPLESDEVEIVEAGDREVPGEYIKAE